MDSKALAEDANWRIAHEWHEGLGLLMEGVDLGDVLTYEVLRILGQAVLSPAPAPETEAPHE